MVEENMFTPVDACLYESNMTILAVVEENGNILENVQQVAVLDGSTCIAAANMNSDGYFYLTVPGDKTTAGRLTIIAVINGNIVESSASLYFGEDVTLGNYDNPFAITVGETTGIDKMFSEGNCSRMQVAGLNGHIFYSGPAAGFNENSLNDGQYIFKFFTTEGQRICYKRFIKRQAE